MTEKDDTPGTVHLIDLEGLLIAQHATGSQKDIVLVPEPSADLEDPLNWSTKRRVLSASCVCVYTLCLGITSAAIYSVLEPLSDATSLTLSDLNSGTGYMFLMFGWGCLIWQPLALQYGKRPAYLLSLLVTLVIMVWVPYTNTRGQWIGSKLLQGFFGAPVESLCSISLADITFSHNRGSYIALYGFFLSGSSFLAPILAGFINDAQGWKWVLYWCAILCAVGFVFLFFFMEETNFHREIGPGIGPTTNFKSDLPAELRQSSGRMSEKGATEQASTSPYDVESRQRPSASLHMKSILNKLKVFDKKEMQYPNHLRGMFVRPLIFLTFPLISYSGFMYGSHLIWFNILNGTSSLILSKPPYGFSASIVGVCYVSPLIGVILAAFWSGRVADYIIVRLARSNNGVYEPEQRLWLFGLSAVLLPSSLILWGVGAAHSLHWLGVVFAMGMLGFAQGTGAILSISFCIDCHRELSGEAIVTVILIRNTMSFAVSYGITPWVTNLGLQNAFILAAFVGLAQVLTFLVIIKFGKRLRQRSAPRYWKYVKEMKAAGLVH